MTKKSLPVSLISETLIEANIRCRSACPVGTNAGLYAQLVAQGRFEDAYRVAASPNPFVSVCARVCAHPCEDACRRGLFDSPVAIRLLKRSAVEKAGSARTSRQTVDPSGPKVAIIGAGPAGLACAHDLALLGYRVTVFEKEDMPGGMLITGLAPYRLPRQEILADIGAILDLGVELRTGVEFSKDVTFKELEAQGFQAFFLAVGAGRSRRLNIEGVDLPGVRTAIDFLRDFNLGRPLKIGRRVLVIGGGNVAVDAARAAARAGAAEVTMVCLESLEEMPAWEWERAQALQEGIMLITRRGPARILGDNQVTGLETIAVESVFDAEGRFNPTFIPGSEETIPCDQIILAIGQEADLSFIKPEDGIAFDHRGRLLVDRETLATSRRDVFAGGDGAFGPRIVIDAVADGRKAARSIDLLLAGSRGIGRIIPIIEEVRGSRRGDDYLKRSRREEELRPVEARQANPELEVEMGLEDEEARYEGSRCLRCNTAPIWQPELCILCGLCEDVCPFSALRFVEAEVLDPDKDAELYMDEVLGDQRGGESAGTALVKDEDRCIRCALCAERCPTGAMIMGRLKWEEEESWDLATQRERIPA